MVYFISGHRNLSYKDFEEYYIPVIDNIIWTDNAPIFVVGDCNGVDKFAMNYIYNTYNDRCVLNIFHMFESPRNTPLNKKVCEFDNNYEDNVFFFGGFISDEDRDSAMTKASDTDIAFIKDNRWNSGTAQNIKRRHGI